MGSKPVVFLGLLLATVLLIASEVTARDFAETSTFKETSESFRVYSIPRTTQCRHTPIYIVHHVLTLSRIIIMDYLWTLFFLQANETFINSKVVHRGRNEIST